MPCEFGRSAILLQEGQAPVQEACPCYQCLEKELVVSNAGVKQMTNWAIIKLITMASTSLGKSWTLVLLRFNFILFHKCRTCFL